MAAQLQRNVFMVSGVKGHRGGTMEEPWTVQFDEVFLIKWPVELRNLRNDIYDSNEIKRA